MKRGPLAALTLGLVALPSESFAQELRSQAGPRDEAHTAETLVFRLTQRPFVLVDGAGRVLGAHSFGDGTAKPISEQEIVQTLQASQLTSQHAAALWSFFADLDNASVLTLPIVKSLVIARRPPRPAKRSIASSPDWRGRSLVTILLGIARGHSWVSLSVIGLP